MKITWRRFWLESIAGAIASVVILTYIVPALGTAYSAYSVSFIPAFIVGFVLGGISDILAIKLANDKL